MPDLILSLIKLIALLAALAFLALILLFLFWTVYMLIPKKWRRKFKPRSKSFATIETPQILPGPLPYQGPQWSSSLLPIKKRQQLTRIQPFPAMRLHIHRRQQPPILKPDPPLPVCPNYPLQLLQHQPAEIPVAESHLCYAAPQQLPYPAPNHTSIRP